MGLMEPHYADARVTVYAGDCLDVLRDLDDVSIDAVCCDPPYGLEFMGKEWDGADGFRRSMNPADAGRDSVFGRTSQTSPEYRTDSKATAGMSKVGIGERETPWPSHLGGLNPKCRNCQKWQRGGSPCQCDAPDFPNERLPRMHTFQQWCELWATECLRVLKPGGHMLAFGGCRTWHRLACAIEDAGFEIRDSLAYLFGSGFPKSLNVTDALGRIVPLDARCVCGQSSTQTLEGSPVGYPSSDGSDGGRPQLAADTGLALPPSPGGVRVHSRDGRREDALAAVPASTALDAASGRPSSAGSSPRSEPLSGADQRSASAQSDTQTSTSDVPAAAHRRTDGRTPHTLGSAFDSARYKHMACPVCGGVAIPQGIGTALKPGHEPIVVARKPLTGTVAQNVLEHGTGALNIDATRIGDEDTIRTQRGTTKAWEGGAFSGDRVNGSTAGRWPANVVLDESQAAALDAMSGELTSGSRKAGDHELMGYMGADVAPMPEINGDRGGASRYFYTAKAPGTERVKLNGTAHPTVKPLDLMRWLVRLVTPPLVQTCSECCGSAASCQAARIKCCPDCTHGRAGVVLDPFAGSGTTVEACILEGFRCIAIEREPDYLPLIMQRINRRIDPVAAVKATAEDGGLFDLLGEETA